MENSRSSIPQPDQVQRLRSRRRIMRLSKKAHVPLLIVCNVTPVIDGSLLVDIVVPAAPWRFVFRRCRWIIDGSSEHIEPAGGTFEFLGEDEFEQFQRLAVHAAREQLAGDSAVQPDMPLLLRREVQRRRPNQKQKQVIIAELLTRNPELSDRAIAKMTTVDHKTVAAVRSRTGGNGETPHNQPTGRIEVSGRRARGRKPGSRAQSGYRQGPKSPVSIPGP